MTNGQEKINLIEFFSLSEVRLGHSMFVNGFKSGTSLYADGHHV